MADSMVVRRALVGAEVLWTKALHLGTGCCVMGFEIDRYLDQDTMEKAAVATAGELPFLRAQIVGKEKDKPEYVLSSGPWKGPVRTVPWPLEKNGHIQEEGLSELHRIAEMELNKPFTEKEHGTPIVEIHLYGRDSSSILFLRLHGSAFDRMASVKVGERLLANLDAALQGHLVAGPPASLELPVPSLERLPKDLKQKGFFAKTFDSVGYVRTSMKSALLPFQPGCSDYRKNKFHTEYVEIRLGQEATRRLTAECAKNGSSVYGAESAALVKAVARLKELGGKGEEFQMTSLSDVRRHLEPPLPEDAVGFYNLALPISYKVSEKSSFWEIAQYYTSTATENIAKKKIFKEMSVLDNLFSTVLSHPSMTPEASLRTALFSAFTDAPLYTPWRAKSFRITDSVGPCISMHGVGACVALPDTMQDENLHITLIYPSPLFSRATMKKLAEYLHQNLLEATLTIE